MFITDALQSKLNLSGAEVNLQVNTIVGTNTVRMRRVPGLQIRDINGEYSPVKVPYAYAQPKIPATHSDIATPDIVRQWDHLKDVADEIHYRSDIETCMLFMAKQTSLGQRNTNLDGQSSVLFAWIKRNPKNVVAYQSIALPF